MPDTKRAKLELAVLEARLGALNADSDSKVFQHNKHMEIGDTPTDDSAFELFMLERNREVAELNAEIAKKRLDIAEGE
jgi:hypothetical protein